MKIIENIGNHSKEKIDRTAELLYCFSNHLKGKKDCRGEEYEVNIGEDFVKSESGVRLCHDKGKYSKATKSSTVVHVISQHFPNYFIQSSDFCVTIKPQCFIKGTYKYRLATSGKYRRWEKEV